MTTIELYEDDDFYTDKFDTFFKTDGKVWIQSNEGSLYSGIRCDKSNVTIEIYFVTDVSRDVETGDITVYVDTNEE